MYGSRCNDCGLRPLDLLGRTIAAGVEGFDGYENVTRFEFNPRGLKLKEYAPVRSAFAPGLWDGAAASPYTTSYSRFDSRGRPGMKTVLRDAGNLFQGGSGDASLVTTYPCAAMGSTAAQGSATLSPDR